MEFLWSFTECTDGAVRLLGGSIESEGTVEICFDNLWGLVTQSKWSTSDARVTCKQLGSPSQNTQMSIFFALYTYRLLFYVNVFLFTYNVHLHVQEHRSY